MTFVTITEMYIAEPQAQAYHSHAVTLPAKEVDAMRTALVLSAVLTLGSLAVAQTSTATVYIQPTEDGFQTYLAAAIHKKKVPLAVVTNPDGATFTLTAAAVEVEKVSTGKKLVNCLFAYCAGSEDKASTSVTLTDGSGAVVWSYAVNKGRGAKNRQSMAEAIAKHLAAHLRERR